MRKNQFHVKEQWSTFVPYIGLIAVFVMFTLVTQGKILKSSNVTEIINQVVSLALLSMGAIFLYSHGGMDFSCGAVIAVSDLCFVSMYNASESVFMAILTAIIVAVLAMLFNGAIVVSLKIPPFVGSLCLQYICRGIVSTALTYEAKTLPFWMEKYDRWSYKAIAIIIVLVIVVYLFNYTRIGRYNKAIGGNALAAAQAGVNVAKYKLIAYMIYGVCVGIASIFLLLRVGGVFSQTGQGMELNLLFALVLGGMSMSGGARSSIQSGIIGAFTITILQYGLRMVGVDANYIQAITGIIFLIVVGIRYEKNPDGLYT